MSYSKRDYYWVFEKGCDFCTSSVSELQFANMQIAFLINAIEEVESLSTVPMIKMICKNYIERHELDKLAHATTISIIQQMREAEES